MKVENQPLVIIGVSLAALAILALVTESDIIINYVFAFGIIFIVLTVYRLTRSSNELETPIQRGADDETQRAEDHKRKPPRRRGPKGPPSS
jgi:threonine/homoserine/homoserine lactone efflux protein